MTTLDLNMQIMLVDDKTNMRRTMKNLLRRIGFSKFIEAEDGDTALTKIRAEKPDIVLCDWNMPRMSGIEVLRAVRDNDELADIPFIIVTAEMDEATVAEAGEQDVDAYILKPFTPGLIQDKLEAVMDARNTPSPIDTHLNLADVYLKSKQFNQAFSEYQKALKINNKSPRVLFAIGRLREIQDNLPKAKDYYLSAVKLSPQFLKAHEALAAIYRRLGDERAALNHLQTAVKISPKNVDRQLNLGKALLSSGRAAEARKVFDEALRFAGEAGAEVSRQIGEAYLEAGLEADAEGAFLKGLATNPDDIHLYNRLGIAYRKQKKFSEAINNYHIALGVDPENENLYYNLGRVFYEHGDPEQSAVAMRRALELYPHFEEAEAFLTKVLKQRK